MERRSRKFQGIAAAVGLLVLIFDSALALEGARAGVELCIRTVIPSLLPFFILSTLLTNSFQDCAAYPLRILSRFFGIPDAAASLLIPSVFGGYPVGAKCAGDFYQRKLLSRSDAERLLAFCSNAGPSFLFGMVSGFFPEQKWIWQLWLIHLFSAVLTAASIPGERTSRDSSKTENIPAGQPIMLSAAKSMTAVCCWVILFRTVITFLKQWFLWMLPAWGQVFVIGGLELTNGCCELFLVENIKLRFILCSCMLAFGGICVLFQTASVTNGLSLGWYVKGKLLQTAFSLLLSCAVISDQGVLLAAAIPVFVLILRKKQKRYGNPRIIPV